ncbi:YlcI/YnfO family protein [Luteococcus sp. Sow4_B9]|uniref:YlcI/YnfO family protein n=1 Tax=Luteococcus sp. Sow4_B9 TaxID=3438792 RepID=UPI003F9D465F
MTTQIAVRLPDELVAFLDQSVAEGLVTSRAALVSRAVEREMRRQSAIADAAILATQGAEDDLDELVIWAAANTSFED